MNSFNDEFNPDQTRTNSFYPMKYDQVARWIERLSPDAVTRLGWHSTDDLWDAVNQEYSLYESSSEGDEVL